MFLLDDTTNRGSDVEPSLSEEGSVDNSILQDPKKDKVLQKAREVAAQRNGGYEPGSNLRDSYSGQGDDDAYESQNNQRSIPSNFDDSGFQSVNDSRQNEEFQDRYQQSRRGGGISPSSAIQRARATAAKRLPKEGNKALEENKDVPFGKELAQQQTAQKAKQLFKDRIGSRLGKGGNQKGDDKDGDKAGAGSMMDKLKGLTGGQGGATKNPKAAIGETLDEYTNIGAWIGLILWAIWGILSLVSLVLLITIVGIPVSILVIGIFNLLLIKPKWVYKLTVYILFLIGVGEVLETLDKLGLEDTDIRLNGWLKLSIILFDFFTVILLIVMFVVFLSISCWLGEQTGVLGTGVAEYALKAYDWWNGTQYASVVNEICTSVGYGSGQ